jgi:hypothetical protein
MIDIYLPEKRVQTSKPLIFLAGPIRGTSDWQSEAIQYFLDKEADVAIANPRRTVAPGLEQYVREGTIPCERQRAWELDELEVAARTGAIVFWLQGETEHKCEKSYGAMTRAELGHWLARYAMSPSVPFVIGSDGKFSELDTLLVDVQRFAPDLLPLYSTLAETCGRALDIVTNRSLYQ